MSANYLRYDLKWTLSYWTVWKLPRPACPLAHQNAVEQSGLCLLHCSLSFPFSLTVLISILACESLGSLDSLY